MSSELDGAFHVQQFCRYPRDLNRRSCVNIPVTQESQTEMLVDAENPPVEI